jgi:hypothetical protein
VLLRLLAPEAGYHRQKNFSYLSLRSLNLIIRRFKSSSQLVCKINEKIFHWASNWCRSEERCYGRLCMSWGKSSFKSWDLWKLKHIASTTVYFSKDSSVGYCAGGCWTTYSWKDLQHKKKIKKKLGRRCRILFYFSFDSFPNIVCVFAWYLSSLCINWICSYMIKSLCLISAKFSCCILMIDSYFFHAMKILHYLKLS